MTQFTPATYEEVLSNFQAPPIVRLEEAGLTNEAVFQKRFMDLLGRYEEKIIDVLAEIAVWTKGDIKKATETSKIFTIREGAVGRVGQMRTLGAVTPIEIQQLVSERLAETDTPNN